MLYKLAHTIQKKMPWLWDMAEDVNAAVFAMMKRRGLKRLDECCDSGVRVAQENDAAALAQFFARQPKDAFRWFKPHAFDEASIRRLLRMSSYIRYVQEEAGEIIGYAFLRCFCNGKSFLGKMVDHRHQGKGVCTRLCVVGMRMSTMLGIRMFESINKKNVGSMKASQKACRVVVVEELEDGDMLIEDMPQ